MSISKLTASLDIVSALEDEPNDVGGLSASELKAKFDEAGNVIKTYLNDVLTEEITAENVPFAAAGGIEGDTVQAAVENVHSQIVEMAEAVIPNGSVTSAKLASSAVTSAKIASSAVTADKLAPAAVTSAKIGPGAVTEAKLASAVTEMIAAAGAPVKLGESVLESYASTVTLPLNADISGFSRLVVLVHSKLRGTSGTVSFSVYAGQDAAGQQIGAGSAGTGGEMSPARLDVLFAANSASGCEIFTTCVGSSAACSRYAGDSAVSGAALHFAAGGTGRFDTGSRFIVFGIV